MKLIFIHGRAQERKDIPLLEMTWKNAFRDGLKNAGLPPLNEDIAIEFPFYGDTLIGYLENPSTIPKTYAKTTRSSKLNMIDEEEFAYEYWKELLELTGQELPSKRGIKNWAITRKIAQLIDNLFTGKSIDIIKKETEDVYLYLINQSVQQNINDLVYQKFDNKECVVVGHSLGSIISFILLKTHEQELNVIKLITLGSPLGIGAIKELLPFKPQMPSCVKNGWYNAYDDRDYVALNPLDTKFLMTIKNNKNVTNEIEKNPHDIVGYLRDKTIAKVIYEALNG